MCVCVHLRWHYNPKEYKNKLIIKHDYHNFGFHIIY